MNAEDYLKNLDEPAPAREAVAGPDPQIQAALAAQAATFKEQLDAQQKTLDDIQKANAPVDPDLYIDINGKQVALPTDEETWGQWRKQARDTMAAAEDPESFREGYENFMDKYYKWGARQEAAKHAPAVSLPETLPTGEEQVGPTLDAIGLTVGTKGRKAVERLVEAGESLESALDLIGADPADTGRIAPRGRQRVDAMERATSLPEGEAGRAAPSQHIIDKYRRAGPESVGKSMNRALVERMKNRNARTFKRA